MPKMKTHKGIKKRVTVSKKGKIKRKKAGSGHLMAEKNGKRRRNLRKKTDVFSTFAKRMMTALRS
ncbi:MAG: 50S ribosomal protein L35 [Candidatus Anammoxibacter sp.]